jgi:hypothetical protein
VTFPLQNQRFTGVFLGTPFGLLPVGVAPHHGMRYRQALASPHSANVHDARSAPFDGQKGKTLEDFL